MPVITRQIRGLLFELYREMDGVPVLENRSLIYRLEKWAKAENRCSESVAAQLKTVPHNVAYTYKSLPDVQMKYSYFSDLHAFKVSWNNYHHETSLYTEENCYLSFFHHNNCCCIISSRDQPSPIKIIKRQNCAFIISILHTICILTNKIQTQQDKAIVYSGTGYGCFQNAPLRF